MKEKVINERAYVREPVDNMARRILKEKDKRIILTGGRGVGKSTVLYNLEQRGLGQDEQTIITAFDSAVPLASYLNEEIYRHHYELKFCFNILYYINCNYPLVYDKYFKDTYNNLYEKSVQFSTKLNHNLYLNLDDFGNYLETKEYAKKIIEKLRNILGITNLNLGIDRFDWVDGVSKVAQTILKEYFSLFDKVILTTDDESINYLYVQRNLSKEYNIMEIDYSKDVEIVKMILRKSTKFHKEINDKTFGGKDWLTVFNQITNEDFNHLIMLTERNLKSMISIMNQIVNNYYEDFNNFDLKKELNLRTDTEIKRTKMLKKQFVKPKLYL